MVVKVKSNSEAIRIETSEAAHQMTAAQWQELQRGLFVEVNGSKFVWLAPVTPALAH